MLKKILTNITLLALLIMPFVGHMASAASIDVGNAAINRANLDGYSNFTIIDENNPVSADGYLDTFTYYAANTNSFEFVLVDESNMVKWVSPMITPSAEAGVKTWSPASSIAVEEGWNLGVHFDSTGTIPFDLTGEEAPYTANNSGMPTVGSTLSYESTSSSRTYSWMATGDTELPGTLNAEDFGVMDMSGVKGYTAGFGLDDATFEDVQSVVIKLYSGSTLLQTNTATSKVGDEITGSQISSPFDVFGTFDYEADGYWVNERESEYGQNLIPTRVTVTVTLENGKVVTAENTNLTGDPSSIFPETPPAPTAKDECKALGWKTFTSPVFKNQGQCIKYMNNQ